MVNYQRAKHPLTILKLYSQFLSGASDEDLLHSGVSGDLGGHEAELAKIKLFHTLVSQNKKLLTISCETGINQSLTKKMMNMYEAHQDGKPVSHCPKRSKMTLAFTLFLDGLTDDEILDKGVSASDIDSAKRFLEMIPDIEKMLLATIAQQFQISRHSVARMLRIHRDKQAEITMEEIQDIRIPILA
jgi:hypothetical protein